MSPSEQPAQPQPSQPSKPQNAWEKKLSFGAASAKGTPPAAQSSQPAQSVANASSTAAVEPQSTQPSNLPKPSGKRLDEPSAPVQMPPSAKSRDTSFADSKLTFGTAYSGSPQQTSNIGAANSTATVVSTIATTANTTANTTATPSATSTATIATIAATSATASAASAATAAQPQLSYASIALKNAPPQTTADGKQLPVGISTTPTEAPSNGKIRFGNNSGSSDSGWGDSSSNTSGSGQAGGRRQSYGKPYRKDRFYQQQDNQRGRYNNSEPGEQQQQQLQQQQDQPQPMDPFKSSNQHQQIPPSFPPQQRSQQSFLNSLNPAANSFAPTPPAGYMIPQMPYYAYMPYAPVQYAPPPNYAGGFIPGYPGAPPNVAPSSAVMPSRGGPVGGVVAPAAVPVDIQSTVSSTSDGSGAPSGIASSTVVANSVVTTPTSSVPPKQLPVPQAPMPTLLPMAMPFIPGNALPPAMQQQQQQQQSAQQKPAEPLFKRATSKIQIKLVNPDTKEEIKLPAATPAKSDPAKATDALAADGKTETGAPTTVVRSTPSTAPVKITKPEANDNAPVVSATLSKPEGKAEVVAKPETKPPVKISAPSQPQATSKPPPPPIPAAAAAAVIAEPVQQQKQPVASSIKEVPKPAAQEIPQKPPGLSKSAALTEKQVQSSEQSKPVRRSPSPAKHSVASKKKIYPKEVLLQFRDQCRDRPAEMKPVEVVVGEDIGHGAGNGARRASRKSSDRASDASFGAVGSSAGRYGGRSSAETIAGPGSARGPRGSAGISRQSSGSGGKYPPAPGSASRGGGSKRGRGSRNQAEREQPVAPAIALPKSENRWVPTSIAAAKTGAVLADKEETEEEALYRKAQGLLNKLTPEKFDKITAQLLELPITSPELNAGIMRVIFDKALDEPKFSSLYAKLCIAFIRTKPKFDTMEPDSKYPNDLFRRILAKTCQQEYENEVRWAATVDMTTPIDQLSTEQLAVRTQAEANRRRMKRRTLGNIKFIGELFKLGMLASGVMWRCLIQLFNVEEGQKDHEKPEEEFECLCDLMETIGERLDQPGPEAKKMQMAFDKLKEFSENPQINSRIRFKMLDIIDMRKRGWKARERQQIMNAGPMTIDAIHKMAVEKERLARETARQRKEPPAHRKPSGINGGWKTDQPKTILKRDGSAKSVVNKDRTGTSKPSTAAASSETGAGMPVDKPGAASREMISRSTSQEQLDSGSRGNMFQALMMENGEESPLGADVGEEEGAFNDLPKQIMERVAFEKYYPKTFLAEFALSLEEGVESGFTCLLKLRSFVADDQMTDKTLDAVRCLLDDYCKPALHLEKEESFKKVESFANVIAMLFQTELVPADDLLDLISQQLTFMPDMVVDAPGLPYLLAVVSAVCVLNEVFDLKSIRDRIFQSVEQLGDFTPFIKPGSTQQPKPPAFAEMLAVLLSTVQRLESGDGDGELMVELWRRYCDECGEDVAVDKNGVAAAPTNEFYAFKYPWWGTDRKRLEDITNSTISQWLEKHGLAEALLQQADSKTVVGETPAASGKDPEFEPKLKQLLTDGVELDALRSYLGKQPSLNAEQVFLLTDNILRQSDGFVKYAAALKPYFSKVDNQVQLIYRVQDVGHSAQYKSDGKFFHKVFEKLYDEDVVSEEAFKAWEADGSHLTENKGTTMARGGQTFLNWLKTADAE